MKILRAVSLSDLHYPFTDFPVYAKVLDFIQDYKPHIVILNGDMHDMYDLSKHDKNPERRGLLKQEVKGFRDEILAPLQRAAGSQVEEWIYNEGNHERRLTRYLWRQAPELNGLEGLTNAGDLLGLKQFDYRFRPVDKPYSMGHLLIFHGHIIRQHGGWTARAHYLRYGTSLLVGHSHRWGSYPVRDWKGCHIAEEQGCLCDLNPEYDQHPNWQQGFATILLMGNGAFDLRIMRIVNREWFFWGNRAYEINAENDADDPTTRRRLLFAGRGDSADEAEPREFSEDTATIEKAQLGLPGIG